MLTPEQVRQYRQQYSIGYQPAQPEQPEASSSGGWSQQHAARMAEKPFDESPGAQFIKGATAGAKEAFQRGGERIVGDIKERAEKIQQAPNLLEKLKQAALAGTGTAANVVRTAFEAPIETISGGISELDEVQQFASDPKISRVLDKVNTSLAKAVTPALEKWKQFEKEHPDLAPFLADAGEILLTLAGEKPLQKAIQTGAQEVRAGAETAGRSIMEAGETAVRTGQKVATKIVTPVTETATKIAQKVQGVARGTTDIAKMAAEGAKRIPQRMATNIAEKQAFTEAVNTLPTETARKAALDGIDIKDVRQSFSLTKGTTNADKEMARNLVESVKKFSRGDDGAINPIEIVGKPLTQRLKKLEQDSGLIGKELGDVANNLGDVRPTEIYPEVIDALKRVRGLSGLKSKGGTLNFDDTVFASLSDTERKSIQEVFTEAVKAGSGKSKHQLRQRLFEILGGKKASKQMLTETEEQAFEAIRKGLANVLEKKNPTYKVLNKQFAEVAEPLKQIRSYFRKVLGADEDILDMSGGLLARRITSAAKSNPEITQLLRMLDKVGIVKGGSAVSIEKLQNLYNILDKYYDIAGDTSFKGQIKSAGIQGGGLQERALGAIESVAGETPAIRQKALEDLLEELFKAS